MPFKEEWATIILIWAYVGSRWYGIYDSLLTLNARYIEVGWVGEMPCQ